jgi:hypothetical protein
MISRSLVLALMAICPLAAGPIVFTGPATIVQWSSSFYAVDGFGLNHLGYRGWVRIDRVSDPYLGDRFPDLG